MPDMSNAGSPTRTDVLDSSEVERLSSMSAKLAFKVGNDLKTLSTAADRVQEFGERHGVDSAVMGKVNLCLEELLTNVIRHGMTDDASAPLISVDLEVTSSGLQIELRDSGKAFDPFTDASSPDLESDLEERPIGGLGVHLVKVLADGYEYRRESAQNRVTLTFSLD